MTESSAGANTLLIFDAISSGDLGQVSLLIENGADINKGSYYDTPLTHAIRHGRLDVVRLLIEKGADINIWVDSHSFAKRLI